jgi:hypothetical protein
MNIHDDSLVAGAAMGRDRVAYLADPLGLRVLEEGAVRHHLRSLLRRGRHSRVRSPGSAPTPIQDADLNSSALRSALRRGGHQRNIGARAREIEATLRV